MKHNSLLMLHVSILDPDLLEGIRPSGLYGFFGLIQGMIQNGTMKSRYRICVVHFQS